MNTQQKSASAFVNVTEEHKQFIDNMIEATKQHVGGVVPMDVRHLERLISMAKRLQEYDEAVQKYDSDLMDLAVKVDRALMIGTTLNHRH